MSLPQFAVYLQLLTGIKYAAIPSSQDGTWSEFEIEELEAPKNGLSKTVLEVYAIMRGQPSGDLGPLYETSVDHHLRQGSDVSDGMLGPMPDRHFPVLPNQVTQIFSTYKPSTIGKSEPEIFEHFGFLQIDGKWVDPDNLVAMDKASKGDPDVTNPLLPGMNSSSRPYMLSKSEQSIVYSEFVDDEDDAEGDPRDFRISPETFTKWAEGAVKVEQSQHEVVKQSVSKA